MVVVVGFASPPLSRSLSVGVSFFSFSWGCPVVSSSSSGSVLGGFAASVARSAFRAGSLSSLLLRPSSRSRSGLVLVCGFGSAARAGRFAGLWAGRLGLSVVVLRGPGGWAGAWLVSVPVVSRCSRLPAFAGRVLPVSGGLRGFAASLFSSGLRAFGSPRPGVGGWGFRG